jgi:hypothetical protein
MKRRRAEMKECNKWGNMNENLKYKNLEILCGSNKQTHCQLPSSALPWTLY